MRVPKYETPNRKALIIRTPTRTAPPICRNSHMLALVTSETRSGYIRNLGPSDFERPGLLLNSIGGPSQPYGCLLEAALNLVSSYKV